MEPLTPLETLFDATAGQDLAMPEDLLALYGNLRLAFPQARPLVIGNFVSTLDGVVDLSESGRSGGGPISGSNLHDRMVMGLLRAAADAVVVGAGTLRSVPRHLWTAEYIYPPLAGAYGALRVLLRKEGPPLNVVVTARGGLDPDLPVFHSGSVSALVVTTAEGMARIRKRPFPRGVGIAEVGGHGPIEAPAIVDAVCRTKKTALILIEGGPSLMGDFFASRSLDELFLTLTPQVAGRDGSAERPGFVAGRRFAPDDPRWGTLAGVKRGGSHLFLRYAFPQDKSPAEFPSAEPRPDKDPPARLLTKT